MTSSDGKECRCAPGWTGFAGDFYQEENEFRPTFHPERKLTGRGTRAVFDDSKRQFLHGAILSGSRELKIKSRGGLTIAATVKFSGERRYEEQILDFSNGKTSTQDNIMIGRYQNSSRLVASIAAGGTATCQIVSGEKAIVQDEWLTFVFEYQAATQSMVLKSNKNIIAGPTTCHTKPEDKNLTNLLIARSHFDTYFGGEMRELFVADETMRNLARACDVQAHGGASACHALQSSTWTPEAGTQYHRDQKIHAVGRVNGSATLAVDGSTDNCSQTWREISPWWRVDLEAPRLVVSLRVHGRIDCCQAELEGFEIRVGNWPAWDKNAPCATNVSAPGDLGMVEVSCQAEGRYVFVVVPGTNRSLALCEVEVHGLSNNESTAIAGILPDCTSCISGLSPELAPFAYALA